MSWPKIKRIKVEYQPVTIHTLDGAKVENLFICKEQDKYTVINKATKDVNFFDVLGNR